jgi:hypothetical protein
MVTFLLVYALYEESFISNILTSSMNVCVETKKLYMLFFRNMSSIEWHKIGIVEFKYISNLQ